MSYLSQSNRTSRLLQTHKWILQFFENAESFTRNSVSGKTNLLTSVDNVNDSSLLSLNKPECRSNTIYLPYCELCLTSESGESENVARETHAQFEICTPSFTTRQLPTAKPNTFLPGENFSLNRREFSTLCRKMSEISSPTGSESSDSSQHLCSISALSDGFERIFLNRRRLSTVNDLTTLLEKEGEGGPGANVGGGPSHKKSSSWKDKEARISESSDDDSHASGKVEKETGKQNQDIFLLLEKVIEFRGRNVSHITVEESVKELCTVYNITSDAEKQNFFDDLAENYGVDQNAVKTLANSLLSTNDENVKLNIQEKLRAALIPKYQWLFTQIGRLENGVKFLVDFRTDLLDAIEKSVSSSHVKALNVCVRDLIGMWFAVGFLNLERVTWQSSCDMLQKISEYEAVHPMRNWTDLKRRVGPYRRCFVYTHGSMPSEPVVVLHTALTDHIPGCITEIVANRNRRMMSLDSETDLTATGQKEDSSFIDTAIFYSITSTQRGLMGIELGNYLIKRVVRELQSEFPKMNQFSSLSPIPGFKIWLLGELKSMLKSQTTQSLFTQHEMETLAAAFEVNTTDIAAFVNAFQAALHLNEWHSNENLVKEFEMPLMRLCGKYLYLVKRRGYAIDAVANFHLKNGAVIWRLNWLGDNSPRGLGQSCGMMVNYRYFLENCEINSQHYMEKQTVKISDQVRHLIKLTQSEPMTSKI